MTHEEKALLYFQDKFHCSQSVLAAYAEELGLTEEEVTLPVLIAGTEQRAFELEGETLVSSASREVDYQGAETDIVIYVNGVKDCVKGVYTVEAYTEQSSLGTAELLLR